MQTDGLRPRLTGRDVSEITMNQNGIVAVLLLAFLLISAAGCSYPFLVWIKNTTDSPLEFSLRLAGFEYCLEPQLRGAVVVPVDQLCRLFRDPDESPATGVAFDEAICSVKGTVPAQMALRLKYPGFLGLVLAEGSVTPTLSLHGIAGVVTLSGQQVLRYGHRNDRSFVVEYGEV